MKHYEIEGMRYEVFLKRFYKFDLRISRPKKTEFIQLIESEIDHNADFDSRFTEVKSRLKIALEILYNKETTRLNSSSNLLPVLFALLDNAKETDDISKFLTFVLSNTQHYR